MFSGKRCVEKLRELGAPNELARTVRKLHRLVARQRVDQDATTIAVVRMYRRLSDGTAARIMRQSGVDAVDAVKWLGRKY